jgi:hypothetical protein
MNTDPTHLNANRDVRVTGVNTAFICLQQIKTDEFGVKVARNSGEMYTTFWDETNYLKHVHVYGAKNNYTNLNPLNFAFYYNVH